jgi:hypothetical protein
LQDQNSWKEGHINECIYMRSVMKLDYDVLRIIFCLTNKQLIFTKKYSRNVLHAEEDSQRVQ